MKYTVYQIMDLKTGDKFISAYPGIKNIKEIRISRNDILVKIKNKKIEKKVVSIEKDKSSTEKKLKKLS